MYIYIYFIRVPEPHMLQKHIPYTSLVCVVMVTAAPLDGGLAWKLKRKGRHTLSPMNVYMSMCSEWVLYSENIVFRARGDALNLHL